MTNLNVLYTTDKNKKNKIWHDGQLKQSLSNNQKVQVWDLLDETGKILEKIIIKNTDDENKNNQKPSDVKSFKFLIQVQDEDGENQTINSQVQSVQQSQIVSTGVKRKRFKTPLIKPSQQNQITQVAQTQVKQLDQDENAEIINCVYTKDIHKKTKKWIDGTLKLNKDKGNASLYEENGVFLDKIQVQDAAVFKQSFEGDLKIGSFIAQVERTQITSNKEIIRKNHPAFKIPKVINKNYNDNVKRQDSNESIVEFDLTQMDVGMETDLLQIDTVSNLMDTDTANNNITQDKLVPEQVQIKNDKVVLGKKKFKVPLKEASAIPTKPIIIVSFPHSSYSGNSRFSGNSRAIKFNRQFKLPDSFDSIDKYLNSILNTTLECLQININEEFKNFYKTSSDLARLNKSTKSTYSWKEKGFMVHFDCILNSLSLYNSEDERYSLKVTEPHRSTEYCKDDIWVISESLNFDTAKSAVLRSTWHGPSQQGFIEMTPIDKGQRNIKNLVSNTKSDIEFLFKRNNSEENEPAVIRKIVAFRILRQASELCVIDFIKNLMDQCHARILNDSIPFTLAPFLQNIKTLSIRPSLKTDFNLSHLDQCLEKLKIYVNKYKLNIDQIEVIKQFITSICLADQNKCYPITLCHGVFGAGKSFLLSILIVYLYDLIESFEFDESKYKILISSNTNVAVDRILVSLKELDFMNFTRVGPIKKIDKRILPYTLQLQNSGDQEKEIKELEDNCKNEADEMILSEARINFMENKNRDLLNTSFVVGTTCISTQNQVFSAQQNNGKQFHFPFVFLDECSQMTEATSLLPLASFDAKFAILIGDPNQLPPTLPSASAALENDPSSFGCERTLFERIRDMGIQPIMLRAQYRCHPQIADLSNELFYENKLTNGVEVKDRKPLIRGLPALLFIDIPNSKEFQTQSGSYINQFEAECVQQFVNQLSKSENVMPNQTGVISLYKSQAEKLSFMINSNEDREHIAVSTVDAFQGAEKELIILSTVRAKGSSIGFSDDKRRVNVAITRAKRHLIIFGHKDTLQQNDLWQKIISKCKIMNLEESFQLLHVKKDAEEQTLFKQN